MMDQKVQNLIKKETQRENNTLTLIPSENYASKEVLEASGSVFSNKYSEGYPGKRYYGGQDYTDGLEILAQKRAQKLFKTDYHVNVQPYSGSPANLAIYFSVLKFGDKILGMKLDQGGHITHGLPISFAGKSFHFISYGVDKKTEKLNYDEILRIALKEKPKMIVCGATAYSRIIDFKKFSAIAKKVNAYLLADISHIAGLIVGGVHPTPFGPPTGGADFVMTTTHKTLRGPRGAIIFCKEEYASLIDKAVFPGLQGGPHMNQIAAKAVCLEEASKPEFKSYAEQIVKNAQKLAHELIKNGLRIVSGGTDNHLFLVDLTKQKLTGAEAQEILENAGIICNKNTIPYDTQKPFIGSGIRLGTPALTTRGMREKEMIQIADLITDALGSKRPPAKIKQDVLALCHKFPIPGDK